MPQVSLQPIGDAAVEPLPESATETVPDAPPLEEPEALPETLPEALELPPAEEAAPEPPPKRGRGRPKKAAAPPPVEEEPPAEEAPPPPPPKAKAKARPVRTKKAQGAIEPPYQPAWAPQQEPIDMHQAVMSYLRSRQEQERTRRQDLFASFVNF